MSEFLQACWQILLDLSFWLLLGALVAGLLHVLLPRDFLKQQFTGAWGVLKAVVLGVPLPLCSCAVIPVGLSLKQSGASSGATVAFLISTPQTGVDSVLVSASFLGWPFAVFKVVSAAVTGIVGGWWTNRDHQPTLNILSTTAAPRLAQPNRATALFSHSLELLRSIWRWLLFGVVVSAMISTLLPHDALSGLAMGGGLAAMVATLVVAVPLYVCATASVPIAAALVGSGLPTGAALVFLMAGPATNMATIGAVYRTLGRRALLIYLGTVIAGSIVSGWLFGSLIDTTLTTADHVHGAADWWSTASAVILLILLGWFAWEEFMQKFRPSPPSATNANATQESCCE